MRVLADVAALTAILAMALTVLYMVETLIDAVAERYDRPGVRIAHDPTFGDCQGGCDRKGVRVTEQRVSDLLPPELRCDRCTPAAEAVV